MPRRANPYSLWFETASAMNAAGMTMAMRFFRMQQAMAFGDLSGGPEAKTMVAEKWTAAYRGYWRGVEAMTRIAFSPPASAAAMQNAMLSVGSAMLAPSRRKVGANARRLTRIR